jgi:hypothetical protein
MGTQTPDIVSIGSREETKEPAVSVGLGLASLTHPWPVLKRQTDLDRPCKDKNDQDSFGCWLEADC